VHAGNKVRSPSPMLWQCSETFAGSASLTSAVGDKEFRLKSSHLSACGKAFLCQYYTVLTTYVESGTLFSCLVFGTCI